MVTKKRLFFIVVFSSLLLISMGKVCSAQEGLAETLSGRFGIGTYGMVIEPDLGNFDNPWGGGVMAKYIINRNFALETAVEFSAWDFDTTAPGAAGTIEGELDVIPWTITAHWIIPTAEIPALEKALFYLGGGLSVIFIIDYEARGIISPGGYAQIYFDDAVGGHIVTGMDWALTDNLVFNTEFKYTWATSETTEAIQTGTLTFPDAELDNLTARVGLTYFF